MVDALKFFTCMAQKPHSVSQAESWWVYVACRWSGLTAAVQMKDGESLKEWERWKVGHKRKRVTHKLLTENVMEKWIAHRDLLRENNWVRVFSQNFGSDRNRQWSCFWQAKHHSVTRKKGFKRGNLLTQNKLLFSVMGENHTLEVTSIYSLIFQSLLFSH